MNELGAHTEYISQKGQKHYVFNTNRKGRISIYLYNMVTNANAEETNWFKIVWMIGA